MPTLSRFYGIVIAMYWRDHNPPHFHAIYGDAEALIVIDDLSVYAGSLPTRALRLVREWAELHDEELRDRWQRARAREPLDQIAPLP